MSKVKVVSVVTETFNPHPIVFTVKCPICKRETYSWANRVSRMTVCINFMKSEFDPARCRWFERTPLTEKDRKKKR